jgi:phosphoribosylformylglycinamidine cyclo-ligase
LSDQKPPLVYSAAGVDIDAKMGAVSRARSVIRSTFTKGVVGDIGGFGGLFRPDFSGMADPLLVASMDGVGTKIKVAIAANRHDTVGQDLVNHCVNDILVQGARPLFFLDYFAAGKLVPEIVGSILEGIAFACRENGCALLGGETAEMPGMYAAGDYDLAGTIVGAVDRSKLLDGSTIRPGDVLLGLSSSGLHTNGYSLARRLFFETLKLDVGMVIPELGATVGETLLAVHRSYLAPVLPLVDAGLLSAIAHITGGGFPDNLPRVLPAGCSAEIRPDGWTWPTIFRFIEEKGAVGREEMLRVFNCGIGLVLFVAPKNLDAAKRRLDAAREEWVDIGHVVPGNQTVVYS